MLIAGDARDALMAGSKFEGSHTSSSTGSRI